MKNYSCFICTVAFCIVSFLCHPAFAQTILLSEGFDNTTTWKQGTWPSSAGGWAFFVLPTGQTGWGVATGTSAGGFRSPNQYIYSQPYSNELYMITPPQSLTANVTYSISFWYRNYSVSDNFTLNIYTGTSQNIAGMTNLIGTLTSGSAGKTYTNTSFDFIPPSTGTYYFGIYTKRISGTYVNIDDVLISTPTCTVPCNGWISQNCSTCTKGCYIDGGTISPVRSVQTSSVLTDTSNYGYVYWPFNASADSTYYFDLCSSTGTSGDSWLRLHSARNTSPGNNYCMNAGSTPTILTQNISNGCTGTGTGLSKLIWTCPASGIYFLESALDANMAFWGSKKSQTAVLTYKTLPSSSMTCSNVFYDQGIDGTNGSAYGYNNNENWIYTYYPTDTIGSAISAQFISFSTAPGDILCVYDGSSVNAPIIGCYAGPSITGAFSSTASNGSLTFQFTSDDSLISTGWEANITCVTNVNVDRNSFVNTLRLSPNPVKNKLSIPEHFSSSGTSIEIINMLGEKMLFLANGIGKGETIDVQSLPTGIYFVRIENEKKEWNGRFVKE